MKYGERVKSVAEIAYARSSLRNLMEQDKTGDTTELEIAIAFLDQAEQQVYRYVDRRDGIDTLPDEG